MVQFISLVGQPKTFNYNPKNNYEKCPEVYFIKKIKNFYILYSSLYGMIYLLSEDEYKFLDKKKIPENDFSEFVKVGLYREKNTIKYPNSEEPSEKYKFISIFPTTRCNLKCLYCYARGGEKNINLDFKTAKNFIYNFLDMKNNSEISFHGAGEPTTAFEMIKSIVNYAKSKSSKIKFSIQSNGLFSDKTLDFLLENKFHIALSCDGPPYIQDIQRPTRNNSMSSCIWEKTARALVAKNYKFSVRVTISKYTEDKILEILEYFKRIGVKKIKLEPLFRVGRSEDSYNDCVNEPDSEPFTENLLKAIEMGDEYQVEIISTFKDIKITDRFCSFSQPNVSLTHEGYITCCHEATIFNKIYSPFIYGEYNKINKKFNLNEKKINKLKKWTVYNLPQCKNCFLKFSCAGDCPIKGYIKNNYKMFTLDLKRCEDKRKIAKNYIEYIIEKRFWKKFPYIENRKNKLYFKMFFNEFPLNNSKNNEINGSSIILIDNNANLKILKHNIISEVKKDYNTKLFLFSVNNTHLYKKLTKEFNNFLTDLKKNNVYFKLTKPLPFCISKDINQSFKKYIPISCENCLELFQVNENNKMTFCNGKISSKSIDDYISREEVFREFIENGGLFFPDKCKNCIFRVRRQCKGYCRHHI